MAAKPDWQAIVSAVEAMIADVIPRVTGDADTVSAEDDLPIYWERADAGLPVGRDYWVELSIRSTRDLGMAEVRKTDHPTPTAGAERALTVTAPSSFVLSIKVPGSIQSPAARQNSRSILSALRLAFAAPEYVRAFTAAGFAFSRIVRELSEIEDPRSGRDRAYAVLDVQFNTASAFDARPGTYIDAIRVSGSVDDIAIPAQEIA